MAKKSKQRHANNKLHDTKQKDVVIADTSGLKVEPWMTDILYGTAVCILLLAVYIRTLHPSVPGGDSGELIMSAHELGVAHPPGYPLFTMLAKLFIVALPVGEFAYRVNLLNAFTSAVAGGLLMFAVCRLTRSASSGLIAVVLFSFSRLTWTWSVSAEVFGLNNLFIALIICISVAFYESLSHEQSCLKLSYYGAFVCGLSLCNQHTIVVYVFCVILWVWYHLYNQQLLHKDVLIKQGLCLMAGGLPYLYLPISAFVNVARWTWGDQTTLYGLLKHVLRYEYGTFDLGKDHDGLGLFHGLRSYGEHLLDEITLIGVIMFVLGVVIIVCRSKYSHGYGSVYNLLLVKFCIYTLFFAWRANLDISNPLFRGVVERFWMQSDVIVAMLVALGCQATLQTIISQIKSFIAPDSSSKSRIEEIGIVLALSVMLLQLKLNFQACDNSNNYVIRDFGRHVLDSIPSNAIVLTKGDLPTNSMRYLHLCENERPDLSLLDVEILSYDWSLPMVGKFYNNITFPADFWHLKNGRWPDGKVSFNFKTFLDANYERAPILICIGMQEKDSSWEEHYQLWPHSVCHRVVANGTPLNPAMWIDLTARLAEKWSYPHTGFDDRSWEKVANDEIWNSKVNTAFFMYKEAGNLEDEESRAQLYYASYKGYQAAIESSAEVGFPDFWHKNYALTCERLMHLKSDLSEIELCEESIKHFQTYVDKNPVDKDLDNIKQALVMLKERLKTFRKIAEANKHMGKHGLDPV